MLPQLWTPRRLRRFSLAALAGAVLGFSVFWFTSDGLRSRDGGRVGGDFPAFYGAGQILRNGGMASLYEPETQRRTQASMLPGVEHGWVHFAYAPQVAAAYVPFTYLDFKHAYLVHTLLMAACAVAAVWALGTALPSVRANLFPAIAASMTFYPMYRSIVGGQNTALTLLFAAGTVALLARRRDVAAGLWLSLLLFKPQFGLPVAAILAIGGYPRVLVGLAIGAVGWYVSGVLLVDASWPLWWWREGVTWFVAADLWVDSGNGVSIREVASDLRVPMLGWIAAAGVALFSFNTARRSRNRPAALMGVALCTASLVGPHALYYDAGFTVLGFAAVADARGRNPGWLLPFLWVCGGAHMVGDALPASPLIALVIGCLVLSARAARTPALDTHGEASDRLEVRGT